MAYLRLDRVSYSVQYNPRMYKYNFYYSVQNYMYRLYLLMLVFYVRGTQI